MPLNEVLPSFYVLDSVVKLVGGSFVGLLGEGLKELFMEAFYRMPDGRTRLCHVLDTWKNVFPAPLLADIRLSLPSAQPVMVAPPPPPPLHPQQLCMQGPPPEKRLRLDTMIQQQERDIAAQAQQALAALEQEMRRQRHAPTPQQVRELEELRSVLMQLHSVSGVQVPVPVPVPVAVPVVAHHAPTVMPMQVSSSSGGGQADGSTVRALDTLYSARLAGRPCPTCALRFRDEASYKDHLDWHFKQNKLAGKARQVQSRAWYLPVTQWHTDGASDAGLAAAVPFEAAGAKSDAAAPEGGHVAADSAFKSCAVCNEPFEPVWDDDDNEWVYRNASKLASGGIAHIECQKTVK